MTTADTDEALKKNNEAILKKMKGHDMIEMATGLAILEAGGNGALSEEQRVDIARAWVNLLYFSSVSDVLQFIAETIVREKLDPKQIRGLIGSIGTLAQEKRGKLITLATTLSTVLCEKQKESSGGRDLTPPSVTKST